jgi:hypothetical protein
VCGTEADQGFPGPPIQEGGTITPWDDLLVQVVDMGTSVESIATPGAMAIVVVLEASPSIPVVMVVFDQSTDQG